MLGGQSRADQIEVSLNEDIKSKENTAGPLGTKDNLVCAKAAPPILKRLEVDIIGKAGQIFMGMA